MVRGLALLGLAVAALLVAACARAEEDEPGFSIIEREMVDEIEQAYVRYPSGDLKVTGWLFVNPFSERDVEPCIIFNHGGVGGVTESTRKKCRWLAKQGYIVFAPSYRGEDDSDGEIEVADGEVDDVLAALRLLENHPGIVERKFVLMGTSHGALVSVKLAARPEARELVKCVVAAYGVMDIYAWYQHLLDNDFDVSDELSRKIYGEGPQDKPEAFAKRHALGLVEQIGPMPIFFVQGGVDAVVPKQQAISMYQALLANGRYDDLCVVYPHGGHGFLFWDDPQRPQAELRDTERAWQEILDFIDRFVGEEPDWDGD